MKIFRVSTLLIILGAGVAGTMLFWTSQNVQEKQDALRTTQQALAKEKQAIRVLRAEWDYLNRPERLEALADEYLRLKPPGAEQLVSSPEALPMPPPIPDPPLQKPGILQPALFSSTPPSSPSLPSVLSSSSSSVAAPYPGMKPAVPPRPSDSSNDFRALINSLSEDNGGAR